MNKNDVRESVAELFFSFKKIKLPMYLAWSDIRQRYRRSTLGPFWITISTAVMVACLGIIFGSLFKVPLKEFLPFLATGLILWSYISTVLTEATTVFLSYEPVIKQLPLPLLTHVLRMVSRNFYILLHNLVLIPFILFIVNRPLTWNLMLLLPGLIVLTLNLTWMALFIGIVCTRFRDLGQIVINVLQIFFYITPIIWMPNALPQKTSVLILEPNPFFHLMEIVRCPIMGSDPTMTNWLVTISLCLIGWFFTIFVYGKYKNRVVYWL